MSKRQDTRERIFLSLLLTNTHNFDADREEVIDESQAKNTKKKKIQI